MLEETSSDKDKKNEEKFRILGTISIKAPEIYS